ncbi:MAG: universal stress protein [Acidobacteriota bacterium]
MKVLFATDGSKQGDAAAAMVKKLDLANHDSIHVISVVDLAVPMSVDLYGGYLPDTSEIEKAAREHATKIVDESCRAITEAFAGRDIAVTCEVLFGSPESRIVETAEDRHIDLIVLGSHGYSRWERLLLGSVSNSVVHHAHCSVLVVRAPADETSG